MDVVGPGDGASPCGPVDRRFKPYATHLLAGSSGSGKTYCVAQILRLKDQIIRDGRDVRNVVFCYSTWQDLYQELDRDGVVTRWVNKMPTAQEFRDLVEPYKDDGGSIVVIDDFMTEISRDLVDIVNVLSRHNKTSTFILFQSLFPNNPLARQISLNVKYMYVFKNPRENAQFAYLVRQIRPQNYKWIVQAYHDATVEPYACFLIDLTQECPEHLRFISSFLPDQFPIKVWVEKKTGI